jgi:hypothetical protein
MKYFLILLSLFTTSFAFSQNLKVKLEESTKVYRDLKEHHALVVFETSLEDLSITPTPADEIINQKTNGRNIYFIETDTRVERDVYPFYIPNDRTYILKSLDSHEYQLNIEDLQAKNVYYYTVVLPPQFPFTISAEYIFTRSSKCGLRVSAGRRFGGYIGYKWGEYKPSGIDIGTFESDVDVSYASYLGYIRQSITGGVRIGVNQKIIPVYLYMGGGYGEYGKQWENPYPVSDSIYFYSDYLKGFDGELGVSLILFKYLSVSAGIDCLFGTNGKISTDYMIGVGVTIPGDLYSNKKRK